MAKNGLVIITVLTLLYIVVKKVSAVVETPLHIEIKEKDGKYYLTKNSEPYYIKGAGGYWYFEKLKQYGGNSIRLWSTVGARERMDQAYANGLTVTLGIEVELERLGFNYDDSNAVNAHVERIKKEVLAFKDHPALLMWGVGNELDLGCKNYKVWDLVNKIAAYIHSVDPHHPTTTMLAAVPKPHVQEIIKRCPDIDVLSINAFKDIPYTRYKLEDAGWKGPYVITEWGPTGYWEADLTPWGAFIEETSSEKARICEQRYNVAIAANSDKCLGSYAFFWGFKQERTHTSLSLFLETGEKTNTVDILCRQWSNTWPENRSPDISRISVDDKKIKAGVYLSKGKKYVARIEASDPDNDPLYYYWEIYKESEEKKDGGDAEIKPALMDSLIITNRMQYVEFNAPRRRGAYRLFVYVYDGKRNAATANLPFYCK